MKQPYFRLNSRVVLLYSIKIYAPPKSTRKLKELGVTYHYTTLIDRLSHTKKYTFKH